MAVTLDGVGQKFLDGLIFLYFLDEQRYQSCLVVPPG
jgi:hypothetical protein